MLNDILTLDQQWLPNQSDFPPILWPWYRAWPSPIMSGFHGSFATGVACQQGTLTTPDTWFRPLFGGLHVLWLLRPVSPTLHRLNDLPKLTFTELRGFRGAFATGMACQQGALTLPDTWFRPPFWDLLVLQLLRPNSSNLPCLYSTFHLEYPLVLSRFCFLGNTTPIVGAVRRYVKLYARELSFFIIILDRFDCIFSCITLCSRWDIIYIGQ